METFAAHATSLSCVSVNGRLLFVTTLLVVFLLTISIIVLKLGFLPGLDILRKRSYERTAVKLVDVSGERLAEISVRIADTPKKQYLGLSATDSLGPREGMLFVHESFGERFYVMRNMSFPIDLIFIAPNGCITSIQHGRLPPDGTPDSELTRHRGEGKYVLELPLGTTDEIGVGKGDYVIIPDSIGSPSFLRLFSRFSSR